MWIFVDVGSQSGNVNEDDCFVKTEVDQFWILNETLVWIQK